MSFSRANNGKEKVRCITRSREEYWPYSLSFSFFSTITVVVANLEKVFGCLVITNAVVAEAVNIQLYFVFCCNLFSERLQVPLFLGCTFLHFFFSLNRMLLLTKKKIYYFLLDVVKTVRSRLNKFSPLCIFF